LRQVIALNDPDFINCGFLLSDHGGAGFQGDHFGRFAGPPGTAIAGLDRPADRPLHCWVLAGNSTINFYERTGAIFKGRTKVDDFAGQDFKELAYEWDELHL
jgi:hypothetical protein